MSATDSLTTVLLDCFTSEGMFENEFAVSIDTPEGKVSLFADRSLIEQRDAHPVIKTYAPEGALPDSGMVRVLLPSEAFETGTRWVQVPASHVHPLG